MEFVLRCATAVLLLSLLHGWADAGPVEALALPVQCLVPCLNGGTCVADGCACLPQWTGSRCETIKTSCYQNLCHNGGVCVENAQTYYCQCPSAWLGTYCDVPSACNSNTCLNGGFCVDTGSGAYKCFCNRGYSGVRCEIDVNECVPYPCFNGGVCYQVTPPPLIGNLYYCVCQNGYAGADCSSQTVPCLTAPCRNGGSCTAIAGRYQCQCTPKWTGAYCELSQAACEHNNCQNGGSCYEFGNSYLCDCPQGWLGTVCDQRSTCVSNPCRNSGTCYDVTVGSYRCSCGRGFTGINCETDINECAFVPCLNDGSCTEVTPPTSTGPLYKCSCLLGFSGENCKLISIMTCTSDWCLNGGTCVQKGSAFECQCAGGYFGVRCQTVGSTCFPSCSRVTLRDGTTLAMSQLKIGDEVLSRDERDGSARFSAVISYLDRKPDFVGEFYSILIADNTTVSLSALHLIPVMRKAVVEFVHAQRVQLGDDVMVHRDGLFVRQKVVAIDRAVNAGAFAPLTTTGTIVVDGVVVSCYAVLDSHVVGHMALAPLRWWNAFKEPFLVAPENAIDGISIYAQWLFPIAKSLNLVSIHGVL